MKAFFQEGEAGSGGDGGDGGRLREAEFHNRESVIGWHDYAPGRRTLKDECRSSFGVPIFQRPRCRWCVRVGCWWVLNSRRRDDLGWASGLLLFLFLRETGAQPEQNVLRNGWKAHWQACGGCGARTCRFRKEARPTCRAITAQCAFARLAYQ